MVQIFTIIDYVLSRYVMLKNEHMLVFEHKNEHMKDGFIFLNFDQRCFWGILFERGRHRGIHKYFQGICFCKAELYDRQLKVMNHKIQKHKGLNLCISCMDI